MRVIATDSQTGHVFTDLLSVTLRIPAVLELLGCHEQFEQQANVPQLPEHIMRKRHETQVFVLSGS